jgi:AcrR family transcriptional regulator
MRHLSESRWPRLNTRTEPQDRCSYLTQQTDTSVCWLPEYRQTSLSSVKINSMKTQKQSDPRERILAVADRLFYTEGVRATGTEKIMSLAEVAKATFYRHFESKDALVLAYLEHRDQALWDYLSHPTPPKDLREALTRFEQYANWPEVIGCPFLRIASEFPDTTHPFHRLAIKHQEKIVDYLTDLLTPFAIDRRAAAEAILGIIDGAFSIRMLYGNSREISFVASAEAIPRAFQIASEA